MIETLGLEFGQPKIVMTKFGERELKTAPATEQFWAAWRTSKDAIKRAGSDRAMIQNDMGFSKVDTDFGCSLALRERLTQKQAAFGMKIVRKYRRQYAMDVYVRIFGEAWK
ncbi:MAG: hypothetical protein IT537_08560 [Hyphomicrobiales bacterium]|nr:hypothetical protein [Hyphomicrobiales bacterium]